MIIYLAVLGFVFLLAGLYFLLSDFSRFIFRKTFSIRHPKSFIDFGEHLITLFVIFSISFLGFLFYKFTIAFVAYLLSDDLVSFFVIMRGVFTTKSELQNPFVFENLLSGLLLTPALQFATFYFIFRAIRTFMLAVNNHYGNSCYSEGDVLYFGFISAVVFILFEIVFYSQNISGISGIAHITYLSASKFSSICYFLAIAHVNLLKHEQYRTSLPTYVNLSQWENKIIFTPWKTILVTYIIGTILYIPFFTGTQFSENNWFVIFIYLVACGIFYFTLKISLSNSFNFLGVIMLAESPEYLSPNLKLFNQTNEKRILFAVGGMALLFLIFKAKLFIFILFCFSVMTLLYLIFHILAYLIGLFASLTRVKWNITDFNKIKSPLLLKYIWVTLKAILNAAIPMLCFIIFVLITISFFPKKHEPNNEEYITSVFDVEGYPLFLESTENNGCIPVPYTEFPDFLLKCLYLLEDRNFTQQNSWFPQWSNWHGVSFASLYRIFFGAGGSNLNMQLIKNNAFPKTFPQDVQRKFSEAITAFQLSIQYSTEEIVTQYLNKVGFNGGQGHSGLMAASLYTFGLPISRLNPLEMMYLVATLKRSSQFKTDNGLIKYDEASLYANDIKATLLSQAEAWNKQNLISKKEYASLKNHDLRFVNKTFKIACVTSTREFLKKELGETTLKGKTFISGITLSNQQKVSKAVRKFESSLQGYTRSGNFNLYSAALVVNVKTGVILAHHGGQGVTDLTEFSGGNQIGSLFKPFIILELLESGFNVNEIKLFDGPIKGKRTPENHCGYYSYKFVGIDEILKKSLNAPMVNLRELTEPISQFGRVEDRFITMGISKDKYLDLNNSKKRKEIELNYPLGSRHMTLYEIAQVYQTLFNDGKYVNLTVLTNTFDPYKNLEVKSSINQRRIYDPLNTQIIKSALRQTMQKGGTGVSLINLLPKNRIYFAKTGTSDKSIHGYTVLCDGKTLVVAYTTYGKIIDGRLELNDTPPIPFDSGVKSAGVLAALIYRELNTKN